MRAAEVIVVHHCVIGPSEPDPLAAINSAAASLRDAHVL